MIATVWLSDSCGFLTALECTKFDFGWGSAPLGSLQRSPNSLTCLRGALLLRRKERRGIKGIGKGEAMAGKGGVAIPIYAPIYSVPGTLWYYTV